MSCAPNLGKVFVNFQKPKRTVNSVWLHCSAASRPDIDAKEIDSWHRGQNWSCIGYHFFIKTDGTVEYGRDLERTPSAQSGYNTGSIAICLNGLNPVDFTREQFASLRDLCDQINNAYPGIRFRGHKEVAAKACPVFDYYSVLNLDSSGRLRDKSDDNKPVDPPPVATIKTVPITLNMAQVKMGDRHPHVKWVQEILDLSVDGIFGSNTDKAVRSFQRKENLGVDGIVGSATWACLLDAGT